ncbi:MAG: pyridoxal phosphate-dependent aminotransferase [Casimicrobiaceae bacterium]
MRALAARRLRDVAPFHVMEIASRARALEAAGRSVVHLEIGEPDFASPPPVLARAQDFLAEGAVRYTSALGISPLREAIARHYKRWYGLEVPSERIIVTAGGSAALLLACALLVDRDDEWLLTDPSYPCNRHFVRVMEGQPRLVPVGPEARYQFSVRTIEQAWNARTRGVILASPSNPTGTTVAPEEVGRIIEAVHAAGGTVISDETYAGLNYGAPPVTALAHSDRVFSVNSFSKYFTMTGWRLGWLVAPEAAVRKLEILAQNLYISPSAVAQHAALACFTEAGYAIAEARRREFEARRDFFVGALRELGFGIPTVPDGGFFVYADVSRFTDDSEAFALEMLERAGVAFAPGIDFGVYRAREHVRLAYAVGREALEEAVARLERALESR